MPLVLAAALLGLSPFVGCSGVEKAKPQPRPARADRAFDINVPEILRRTVASETIVLGYESPSSPAYRPIVARGYGLVVGLKGTGSRDIPPPVRAHMLAEATRGGFGSERFGPEIAGVSPEELLDSMDTAVVVVEGVIPQGASQGTKFDVRVYAEPRTSTTSLEGGRLYTTLLRPGPLTTGGRQAFEIAKASGPIFVNPFAEPAAVGRDTVLRTVGRVLDGGEVVKDMPLKLRLANPSHTRASVIQSAINARFPQEPGQRDTTARGENDEMIEVHVPPSFQGRTDEFIDLLRHTTISQANPEAEAMFVRRTLQANPILAEPAALRWQALGSRVFPVIRDLYDYAEELPRLAALRAGAKLEDPLVVPHLLHMAEHGTPAVRLQAIRLLGTMPLNPQIDVTLRELLNHSDVEVRLESYEALVERNDPYMQRYRVADKFVLDVIDSSQPLIYITQIGQPRIALFGAELQIERPLLSTAWSNRLMIQADADDAKLEVFYRAADAPRGTILKAEPTLASFIQFLGHKTTLDAPAPGLDLSYAETVGALHEIWRQQHIRADFKAEQDRILAAIVRYERGSTIADRPEFASETGEADPGAMDATSDLGRLEGPAIKPAPASAVPREPVTIQP